MPAREMFFTFNTGIELNKEAIENLKEEFNDYLLEEDAVKKLRAVGVDVTFSID